MAIHVGTSGWSYRHWEGVLYPPGLEPRARLGLYTRERRLSEVCAGLERLGRKRGVLLVQLPPGLEVDLPRLGYFLSIVPESLRVAVEFRHPSWHREEVFRLLEERGAAYCVMSGARLPCVLRATAEFVYVRLHGPDREHLYAGSYPDEDVSWWAARIREWAGAGRDVYAYFNNDGGGNAVRDAARLREFLNM